MLGHPAGQDDGELRPPARRRGDQRGQLAEGAPLVGGRRVARADEDRASTLASSSIVVIASGSVDSALAATVRQPLRDAVATSGASARSEAATTASRRGGWLATSSRGRSTALPRRRSSAAAERRVGRDRAIAEDASTIASTSAPAGIDERSDEAPAAADPPDQRGGDGGGARIEGEEGARLARHPPMLPGPAAGSGPTATVAVRRPRRSRRPSPRAGR